MVYDPDAPLPTWRDTAPRFLRRGVTPVQDLADALESLANEPRTTGVIESVLRESALRLRQSVEMLNTKRVADSTPSDRQLAAAVLAYEHAIPETGRPNHGERVAAMRAALAAALREA